VTVPIREAATVLVVRDGDRGPEVLMLRRTDAAVFSPGAHVFPGGAVDDDDRALAIAACCRRHLPHHRGTHGHPVRTPRHRCAAA